MAGMDHSRMAMGNTPPTTGAADHSAHTAAVPQTDGTGAAAADQKLQQIVQRLVQDSVVLRRIQADSVLRSRWQDPAVRRLFDKP